MKRVLSFVLFLVITLGVITGMDVSVFATSVTSEAELIDIDIYKAQCFLGVAEDSESNSDAVERCNSIYQQYIEEEALSPTQTFLDEAYADETLMAEFALWQMYSLGADSSTIINVPVQKKDYYESLIMAIISQTLDEDSENKKALYIKATGYATTMVDGLCNASGAASKVELLDKFPDVTTSEAKAAIENLFDNNPQLGACDVIDIILGLSSNILDAIDRISAYNTMASLDEYTKQWLDDMYNACDSGTDLALKDALFNLKHSSHSFTESVMVDIKDTSFRLANWSISTTVNTTLSIMAQSNPLTTAVLAGLKLGKTISDICFSASDVCEQFFMLECIYDIQSMSKKVADSSKTNFLNSQTRENALTFIYAVDFCFESIINTDINCMISFLDTLYNGGYLKGLITWIYGATDDYQEAVSALELLRKVRQDNYNFMIKCFKLVLGYNHWDTYEYYFVEDNTIPITGISFMTSRILPSPYPAGYADMIVGDFANIDVQYVPSDTTQRAYTITSDNPEVVEINDNIMTAVSVGIANVTVTSVENPDVSYTAEIKVGEKLEDVETDTLTTRFTYTVNENNEVTITGLVDGYEPRYLTIPSKIDGYPVTSIGDYAFSYCTSLNSVKILDSVTSIGDNAFYHSTNLTSITIPYSVTSIGEAAFRGCNLTTITIPDSVTNIGWYAFYSCDGLTTITIPDSVTSIGGYAFEECDNLTSVTIGDGVTDIGDGAFGDCDNLTSVTIGDSVTIIGSGAFEGSGNLTSVTIGDSVTIIGHGAFRNSTSLTSIEIPDSVTSIGGDAFRGCDSLSSVTIGNGVTSIGNGAFEYCTSLTSITIPDSVTIIGSGAFDNCKKLTSITIPASVTSIGSYAFRSCTSLSSITIPDGVTNIDSYVFANCKSLTSITIPDSVTSIGDGAFSNCDNLASVTIGDSVISIGSNTFNECGNLTSVTIGDSVKIINSEAFYACESLSTITIPDSVISVSESAFNACTSLESINVDENNMNYSSVDGVLFIKDKSVLVRYPEAKADIEYTIPYTVSNIGQMAFYGCGNLISIKIPDTVTRIDRYAFFGCTSLTSVNIPDSVKRLCDYAFYYCSSLISITIPDSVATIETNAFYGFTGTIYCTKGSATHEYVSVDDYNYVLVNILGTTKSKIDYENKIITTTVQSCDDIAEVLGVSETANIVVSTSYKQSGVELCGTGTIITVFDGDDYIGDYTLIVEGDLNGDSVCDVLDAAAAQLYSSGLSEPTVNEIYAANGCISDEIDVNSYQNVVNTCLAS